MSRKNLALDFMRAPGHGIQMRELSIYCEWRKVPNEHKAKLLKALEGIGGCVRNMRYWHDGKTAEAKFLMDIFWNHDENTCPDLEDLLRRDTGVFCAYNPFLEWQDGEGVWHPFSTYNSRS